MKTKFLIPLFAVLGLLCACKGKNSSYTADSTRETGLEKSKVVADTSQNGPKLVKTADIRFRVKNAQETADHIAALAENYKGMVVHHLMGSSAEHSQDIKISNDSTMRVTSFNTTVDMTVKIPPAKMEDFMNQVAHLGVYVNSLRMDVDDKTLDYLSTQMKLKNQKDLVAQQKYRKTDAKSADDLLAFKNNMVDQQIGNRKIEDSVKNSTVTLSFYQNNVIDRELIANDDFPSYQPSVFKRLWLALENGWELCADVFIALTNLWALILVGLLAWLIYRIYKTKKTSELIIKD